MQGFDQRPTPWRRVARTDTGRKDVGAQIGAELRNVFSVANVPRDFEGLRRLLMELEQKCRRLSP